MREVMNQYPLKDPRMDDALAWKVGDRAVWDGAVYIVCGFEQNWDAPDQAALVRKEESPEKGARLVLLRQLVRPAPKRRKVVVREYKHPNGGLRWDADDGATGQYGWKPTGRTREFEVDDE